MRQDSLLARVAGEIGVRIIAPLAGGEFGATLVENAEGRQMVLKALPAEAWAPRFARGAEMAQRVRALGYPAPEYLGTGVAAGAAWSLQERLPGAIPERVSPAQARRLVELLALHRDAAGTQVNWQPEAAFEMRVRLLGLAAHPATKALSMELAPFAGRAATLDLRRGDITHRDFHHRNFLAIGDEVTGVFDWELAAPGDWRGDLMTLGFWSQLIPAQFEPDAAAIAVGALREA
jgi:aminoglycoside phosphotransferase (APT) family kinase protein